MSDQIARDHGPEAAALEPKEPEPEVVVAEGVEQQDGEVAEDIVGESEPAEQGDAIGKLTPPAGKDERQQLAERIAKADLPPALRARLAEVAAAGGGIEAVVQAVEEALPNALRVSDRDISRPAHPTGEAFFHGDADAISDEQAESMARGQLARTGMLRGQRVRVAD